MVKGCRKPLTGCPDWYWVERTADGWEYSESHRRQDGIADYYTKQYNFLCGDYDSGYFGFCNNCMYTIGLKW